MLQTLSKREKVIFYFTVGVVIIGVCFNIFASPLLYKINTLDKEIRVTQTKLKKYLRLLNQKSYIENRYNKLGSPFSPDEKAKDPAVSILSELELIAQQSGVSIIDIRPQLPKETSAYKEIYIDLRAEGSMQAFLKFIYDIENSLSLLRIKKLQLIAKPNSSILEGIFSISELSVTE